MGNLLRAKPEEADPVCEDEDAEVNACTATKADPAVVTHRCTCSEAWQTRLSTASTLGARDAKLYLESQARRAEPRQRVPGLRNRVWVVLVGAERDLAQAGIFYRWCDARPLLSCDGAVCAHCVFAAWPSRAEARAYYTAARRAGLKLPMLD